ncbi:MAG: DJ-1/PfpI family protein [Coxiellaceae bacterium]|nr:DJ-1/PfpI family protein [Coxiellaceae bacterium]
MAAFGFLIYPDLEEMDLVGPWEVITVWGMNYRGPDKVVTIAEKLEPLVCAKGLTLVPDFTFENHPGLDYLLVPGGKGSRTEINNKILINFIAVQAERCKAMLSVCTGALLFEKAGLLKGKKATTHWNSKSTLAEADGVSVLDKRFVRDGDVWTSAGVSAGVDMALAFVAETAGNEVAGNVQQFMEYYPQQKIYSRQSVLPSYVDKVND